MNCGLFLILPENVDCHSCAKVSQWNSVSGGSFDFVAVISIKYGRVAKDPLEIPHDFQIVSIQFFN